MDQYQVIITPKTPFVTTLQADTIFGHLCWALKYTEGEEVLENDFLPKYQGDVPPLLISNGFPEGFLSKPILRPLAKEEYTLLQDNFFGQKKKDMVKFAASMKILKKQIYISFPALERIVNGLSYYNLYSSVFQGNFCPKNFIVKPVDCGRDYRNCYLLNHELQSDKCHYQQAISKSDSVFHNKKNRLSDMVEEGGLFSTPNIFYGKGIRLVVYLKDNYFGKTRLETIFRFIADGGFGADKSIGKGSFDFEIKDGFSLPEASKPNGFMTISNYAPSAKDQFNGYYETITKFGKLGGDWAKSKFTAFKMPLLMSTSGSFFFDHPVKNYYGGLIPDVHQTNHKIDHNGLGFPLGVKVL